MGDVTVFWILRLLLVGILVYSGFNMSRSSNSNTYKRFALLACLFFSIIEGLRWMRGTDYPAYYYYLTHGISNLTRENLEPLFVLINNFFLNSPLSPHVAFMFFSGLLMGGYCIAFSKYKDSAKWGIVLALLLVGYAAENLVRQYLAISILLIAWYFYVEEKKYLMYLCLIAVPFIHRTGLLGVLIFLLLTWKKVSLGNIWIYIGIFLGLHLIWNPDWLEGFSFFLSSLNVDPDSSYSVYMENADRHFTMEGSTTLLHGSKGGVSILFLVISFLSDLSIIIVGYFACVNDRKLYIPYYFTYIGIVGSIMVADIELLCRILYWFSCMAPIVIGLVTCYKNYGKYNNLKNVILVVIFIRYAFYGLVRSIGRMPMDEGCMFIWDKIN